MTRPYMYVLAALIALELQQVPPGEERVALRAQLDRMVDMELRCAAENLAADNPMMRQLLDAIDHGTTSQEVH